jgi:hypothetical protein
MRRVWREHRLTKARQVLEVLHLLAHGVHAQTQPVYQEGGGEMTEQWKIYNFVSGQEGPLPKPDPHEPTAAWVEGWTACMVDGYKSNPYLEATPEYNDYEDGWQAAEEN